MAASVFHSGFYGTASVAGNELPITQWEVQPTVELTQFKNSRSGGFVLREATFKDCQVAIHLDHDFGNNPFAAPFSIAVGALLSTVNLYLHQSAAGALNGSFWSFSSLIVETTPQQLVVDGKITTKIICRGNGSFTYPS
ncbi:MAG: hypothetical protein M3O30_17025 [Planctomycetota bacterium]|nr:hypothetical protein [Planctomycetota bacterium]